MTTRRLIEEWLPIEEIGEESMRERRSMTALPPIYYLHVWWARRPLVASRAAVLASLLPADADRDRFMHVLGIHGDPVKAKARIAKATRDGVRLGADAYGYSRAFSYSPSLEEREWLASEARRVGVGTESPAKVLDPTAGGGSIPLEALRLGLDAFANDLNPVASFVERMTFEAPMTSGIEILQQYRRLYPEFVSRVRSRLEWMFPDEPGEDTRPDGYLWARTLRCPHCGGLIPLSPNWRLAPDGTGVRLVPRCDDDPARRVCGFEIVHAASGQSEGTVSGGRAVCPFPDCARVIDGDEIKAQARSEGLGEQPYAVVYKKAVRTLTKSGKVGRTRWERGYRAPRPEDDVTEAVRARLAERLPAWEAMDVVPTEEIPDGLKTSEPLRYGAGRWSDLFSPRQLYCHGTSVEVFRELLDEERAKEGFGEVQKAAFGYIAISLDKLLNYNSRMSVWMSTREVVANTFNRHDFAFSWSYAEMAPLVVGLGYDWAFGQTGKCLAELVALLRPDVGKASLGKAPSPRSLLDTAPGPAFVPPAVTLSCQSGDQLWHMADRSVDAVVMDPPYYDNVMYAELSDFFHVWLRRTAGCVYPELFTAAATDKESEAVANPALFKGRKLPRELAGRRYRERMAAIFAECRRVLTDDGVLALMFTHKATGAWDALAKGLLDAGFVISASWPVNTEAEGSLHIRDKAAANSTILLVCRPRPGKDPSEGETFWEDLEPMVTREVLRRVELNKSAGISGIDLYLSCFGPALEAFSRHWPVRRGTPRPPEEPGRSRQGSLTDERPDPYAATPDDVLLTARAAVKDWSIRRITGSGRNPMLDDLLAWFVLAWDCFRAPSFPFDEALNLARVVGLDIDADVIGVVAEKKAGDVVLWDSATRAAKAAIGPLDGSVSMLDALHRVVGISRDRSMEEAVEALRKERLDRNPAFKDALRAVLEVLPVSRKFTGYDVAKAAEPSADDFEALETLRIMAFEDIGRPRQLSF